MDVHSSLLTRNAASAAVRPLTDSLAPSLLSPAALTSVPASAEERDEVMAVAELAVHQGAVVDQEDALVVPEGALAVPEGVMAVLKGALAMVVVPAVAWVALEDALASPDEAVALADALLRDCGCVLLEDEDAAVTVPVGQLLLQLLCLGDLKLAAGVTAAADALLPVCV